MATNMTVKSVLITGCSRGIGLELVRQFLKLPTPPVHVFATCRAPEKADELQQLSKDNPSVEVLKIDIEDNSTIESAAVRVEHVLGESGLNLLINNAALLQTEDLKIEGATPESMLKGYRVNAIGPLMVTKRFLPLIRKAAKSFGGDEMSVSRAAIVNMSTKVASIDDNSSGRLYSYRCSKIALNMINKNLSIELAPDKILVVLLHPGWVQTEMGGPNAITSTAVAVKGLMDVMATRTNEHHGFFYDFKGLLIPW